MSFAFLLSYRTDGTLEWYWQFPPPPAQDYWSFTKLMPAGAGILYCTGEITPGIIDSSDFLIMKLHYPVGMVEPERLSFVEAGPQFAGANLVRSGAALRFRLPAAGSYRLGLCDLAGRRRATLYFGYLAAGEHTLRLPVLAPGVYFLTVQSPGFQEHRRLVVVR
jgi:hypothetical protein